MLFWLLAATDGHAKNFSVFIESEGRFRLTPFYDILSMYPVFGGRGLHPRDAKLAMGLTATKGKKYTIEQIFPRHFYQTAKAVGFEQAQLAQILNEFAENTDRVIELVRQQLPAHFPAQVADSILNGFQARAMRVARSRDV